MPNTFHAISPHSTPRFSLFVVELTQQCNFRCKYCCYSGQYKERRVHNNSFMSKETLERTVDFITENHCRDRLVRVTFYGGEALLAIDTMRMVVKSLRERLGDNIEFGISTNAYLLCPGTVDWICSLPKCRVYVSIDGDKRTHDANRVTRDGRATYDTVVGNLRYFAEKYPEQYLQRVDFLVTLGHYGQLVEISDIMRTDEFLGKKTPVHLSFVMPRNKEERLLSEKNKSDFKEMLDIAFRHYCLGEDSLLVKKFIEWTDIFKASVTGDIALTTCVEDMYRLFISTEGDVYLCERFDSRFKLGDVTDSIDAIKSEAENLERRFVDRRNIVCRDCKVAIWCPMCMTSLNYSDNELEDMCSKEKEILPIVMTYARKRRMHDRLKELDG